ncbi:hypothetical protein [Streptomyces sp. NPDC001492]
MLVGILSNLGLALGVATLFGLQAGRIRPTTADLLWAVANFMTGIAAVLDDVLWLACGCAAVTAWCAYDWWHKGGGDGTRRRLKRWARRFQGVRRTAPQGA